MKYTDFKPQCKVKTLLEWKRLIDALIEKEGCDKILHIDSGYYNTRLELYDDMDDLHKYRI